jgi:hypothetical protein
MLRSAVRGRYAGTLLLRKPTDACTFATATAKVQHG